MYCQNCGKEIPSGAYTCTACGAVVPGSHRGSSVPSVHQLVQETRRAARELASATANLSRHLASRAESAARDPSGSAKKVAHRVAKELDAAADEIDRILKDL
jgi:hypothetical protein